ncbi:hypothetical protein PIROE2DRAFT_3471, partial [Piromyces sp. E2]
MINLITLLLFCILKYVVAIPIENDVLNLEKASEKKDYTILGINLWVFITVVSIPFVFIFFCIWCWCIGRRSAKSIEENKRQRYVHEHKQNTSYKRNSHNESDTSSTKKVVNPQKEVEEEIRKHGTKSKKNTAKIQTNSDIYEESSLDIGSVKINSSKASTTSSPVIKEKVKKNNAPSPLLKLDVEKPRRPKKVNATVAVASRMDPTVPSSPRPSLSSIETSSVTSTQSNGSKKKGGKKKGGKKKKETTQLGMSPVLGAPSSPYINKIGSSPQLYYQQMYNAAASQIQVPSVPNPYYAAYSQSPYYNAAGVNVASTLANPYNTTSYLGATPATPTKTKNKNHLHNLTNLN